MSFFSNLAHQISANATDAPRRSFLASVGHAEDVDEPVEKVAAITLRLRRSTKVRSPRKSCRLN